MSSTRGEAPASMELRAPYDTFQLLERKKSIRIVRLSDQSTIGMGIELEFRIVDLDPKSVDYTALSYMWGNPEPPVVALLENHPLDITQNLYEFLSEMQYQNRRDWFWIDAICINQTDNAEKSHQVQMMGEIYQHASNVMIWLGTWAWDPQLVPKLLEKVAKVLKVSDNNLEGKYTMYTTAELDAIRDICYRPYWQRIWTVQERVLASNLSIACGSMHLEWSSFAKDLERHMGDMGTQENKDLTALNNLIRDSPAMQIILKQNSWRGQRMNEGTKIETLVFQYRHLGATDPRDKVFALLALITPPAQWWLNLHPGYVEPARYVVDYRNTTTVDLYEYVMSLKYPQGAQSRSIDREIVKEILPAALDLQPTHPGVVAVIKRYLPDD